MLCSSNDGSYDFWNDHMTPVSARTVKQAKPADHASEETYTLQSFRRLIALAAWNNRFSIDGLKVDLAIYIPEIHFNKGA
jgi:hypothetical protein